MEIRSKTTEGLPYGIDIHNRMPPGRAVDLTLGRFRRPCYDGSMEQRITALSVPLGSVHLDPEGRDQLRDTPSEDHLLRSSIRKRGILDPLQVSDEGSDKGYVIIDGERRFRIARDEGYDRLICVIHPHLSRESRQELRMELKLSVKAAA